MRIRASNFHLTNLAYLAMVTVAMTGWLSFLVWSAARLVY
jgi:hypothetical protein